MKSIKRILSIILLFALTSCNAQIKNAKTETLKIYGNCEMCEKTIEKAGNLKKVAQVDWNKDTKLAKITYDATKTNPSEILKRIAVSGYDSDEFLAPDDAYANLPECCQYKRVRKTENLSIQEVTTDTMNQEIVQNTNETEKPNDEVKEVVTKTPAPPVNQLKTVFDAYFELKDAFVKSDAKLVTSKAKQLAETISKVDMNALPTNEHNVWMKVLNNLTTTTGKISASTDIEKQRSHLSGLSASMYDLAKVADLDNTIYYQNCPMYNNGSNWLSKDKTIKNPFYGSKMLSCGSTTEVIK